MGALAIVVPFLGAALAAASRRTRRRVVDAIAIATAVSSTVLAVILLLRSREATLVAWMGGWAPRGGAAIGIALAVDPLGAGLAALGGLLAVAALVFARRYFDVQGHFQAIVLLFQGALAGFALTGDLFDLFVFFELLSVSAFALAGYRMDEPSAIQGALSFAVTNTVAAFLVLTGVALLYGRTGQLNMAAIGVALGSSRDGLVLVAFALLATGFLVKAAAVPFHFWLPDAHAVAPAPASALFSGAMVTAGVYAVLRLWGAVFSGPLGGGVDGARALLVGTGVLAAVLGALLAFAQRHLKRLLAFSTVSHVGVILAMGGLLAPRPVAAAALYALGHGLAKAALFLLAGVVLHRLRSVDEVALHGRGWRDRWLAVPFALGAAALAGAPPFGTAAADAELEAAARALGYGWLRWPLAFAGAVTAAAVLRAAGRIFLGLGPREGETPEVGGETSETPETPPSLRPLAPSMWAPPAVLLALCAAAGVAPGVTRDAALGAERLLARPAYAAATLGGREVALPEPAPPESRASDVEGLATLGAALALAGAVLGRRRFPTALRRVAGAAWRAAIMPLRRVHTGAIGDDVAWLVVGVAAFTGLAALLLL